MLPIGIDDAVELLNPDGNCLGVALLDAWHLAGLERPQIPLAQLSTVKDAIDALSKLRKPRLLIRHEAMFAEKMLQCFKGVRMHLTTVKFDQLERNATLLCMRSMRQLYGIPYPHGHWVVIHDGKVHDQLLPQIEQSFPAMVHPVSYKVLAALGATLVV